MEESLKLAIEGGIEKLEKDVLDGGFEGQLIYALVRGTDDDENHVAHLYEGTFEEPGDPFCPYAPSSIWRNNVGRKGICKLCLKKLHKQHIASLKAVIESNKKFNL